MRSLDRALSWAITLAVVCLAATLCSPARADECTEYVAVSHGQPAPCDGVLAPAGEAARVLRVEDERDRFRTELVAERSHHALTRDELTGLLRVALDARAACERERVPPPVRRAWWDSPWTGAALGTVVGVVATLTVVALTTR